MCEQCKHCWGNQTFDQNALTVMFKVVHAVCFLPENLHCTVSLLQITAAPYSRFLHLPTVSGFVAWRWKYPVSRK